MPVLGIEVAHDFAVIDGARAYRGAAHTGEGSLQRRSARARAPAEHHDGWRVVVLVVLLRQAVGCCSGCGAALEVVVCAHCALHGGAVAGGSKLTRGFIRTVVRINPQVEESGHESGSSAPRIPVMSLGDSGHESGSSAPGFLDLAA